MAKKLNARCPLQAECERKCAHEGHELNSGYFADGVGYLRAEEAEMEQPSLFDLMEQEVN